MNKIVTFDQAERLERLGFDETISHYYELEDGEWGITNTIDKDFKDFFIRYPDERSIIRLAPSVHEALDWIREEKGIACGAYPVEKEYYRYRYIPINHEKIHSISSVLMESHPLASSALLDAVLTYLENK